MHENRSPLSGRGQGIVSVNVEISTAQVERDSPLLVYADYEAITRERVGCRPPSW